MLGVCNHEDLVEVSKKHFFENEVNIRIFERGQIQFILEKRDLFKIYEVSTHKKKQK